VLKELPDGPAQATWLSDDEKATIAARLAAEDTSERRELLPALRDPRVYLLGLVIFGQNCGAYGVQLWLPQIVQAMGFSIPATGLIVALPFWAVILAMVLCGLSSDMRAERVRHVAIPFLIAAGGFAIASLAPSNAVVLAALVVVVVSIDTGMGVFWTLPSSFLGARGAAGGHPHHRRSRRLCRPLRRRHPASSQRGLFFRDGGARRDAGAVRVGCVGAFARDGSAQGAIVLTLPV